MIKYKCKCNAFLQFFHSCQRLHTEWSISFSLLPFSLWAVLWLEVTSPSVFLQAWYSMSPIWLSLDSAPPHKDPSSVLVRSVSSVRHASVSLAFGHLSLPLLVGVFVSAFGSALCELVATGSWYSCGGSPSTSGPSSSVTSLPSATLGPSALWFSTWLSVPLVSPAKAVQGCCWPFCPHFRFPWWIRNPRTVYYIIPIWLYLFYCHNNSYLYILIIKHYYNKVMFILFYSNIFIIFYCHLTHHGSAFSIMYFYNNKHM